MGLSGSGGSDWDDTGMAAFTLFYVIFCTGIYFQFKEFSGIGLSPDNLMSLAPFIDNVSEDLQFFEYQLRKSAFTLVLHAFLPFGYFLGLIATKVLSNPNGPTLVEFLLDRDERWMLAGLTSTHCLGMAVMFWVQTKWWGDNWSGHPYVRKLLPYSQNGLWRAVTRDIETEFRRIDKFIVRTNPVEQVVVTDNWIVFVGRSPWKFHVAHQSDVSVNLLTSEYHQISGEGQVGGTQYLHIEVVNRKPATESFKFRLNSFEYQNLRDKLRGTIENVRNVQIFQSISERFIDVFREEVANNPTVSLEEETEPCIGCMINPSNVKLVRRCMENPDGEPREPDRERRDPCVNCYCRPMWCLECLAKWFASRQNQQEPESWLGSKCPCPTCRSKFCLLDVALISPR